MGSYSAALAHKQDVSDEERETALADHNRTIGVIQQKMSQVGENDPSYSGLRDQLNQVVADRTALFHPDKGPGALAHLGRMLWEKVHGKPQPAQTQNPGQAATLPNVANVSVPSLPNVAAQPTAAPSAHQAPNAPIAGSAGATLPTMGGGVTLPAAAGPRVTERPQTPADVRQRMATDLGYGAPAAPVNKFHQLHQELTDSKIFTPEQIAKAMEIAAGIEAKPVDRPETWTLYGKPIKDPVTGKWVQPFKSREGQIENRPTPDGYEPPLPSAHLTNQAVLRADYAKTLGKKVEDLTFDDDQNMVAAIKRAGTATTIGTHIAFVPQANGDIKAVSVTTTSSKQFPGGAAAPPGSSHPSPAAPTGAEPTAPTPGGLKRQVSARKTKAGVVNDGSIVGHRATSPETKANTAVDAAENAYSDVKKASQDPTALGDKGIILAWLRGRVNRVTQSEINSVNSLGGAELAWDNGVARITKGQMSPTQRTWFLRSAKENYETAKQVASKYKAGGQQENAPGGDVSVDDIVNALNGTK